MKNAGTEARLKDMCEDPLHPVFLAGQESSGILHFSNIEQNIFLPPVSFHTKALKKPFDLLQPPWNEVVNMEMEEAGVGGGADRCVGKETKRVVFAACIECTNFGPSF